MTSSSQGKPNTSSSAFKLSAVDTAMVSDFKKQVYLNTIQCYDPLAANVSLAFAS